jgi:hypothetical protein
VLNKRVGQVHRRLRERALLTQRALSKKSGVQRWKIGKLEADELARLSFDEVERCLAALGAELEVRALYRGADVDRLLDEGHAALVGLLVGVLRGLSWQVRVEVAFNEWGERGSYDILAWHAAAHALLVIEVKTELGSVEGTLRPLDVKVRLAPRVAKDRFGWRALIVGRALVMPETRTSRRAVERHSEVLRAQLPAASRQFHAWLRAPSTEIGAIWFVSAPGGGSWRRNPSSVRRVRSPKPRSDPSNVPTGRP